LLVGVALVGFVRCPVRHGFGRRLSLAGAWVRRRGCDGRLV